MKKTEFTRNEIFVIKACKGQFGKYHGWGDARKVIQHVIYGHPKPHFEQYFRVVTELLLNSREWTAEQWNEFQYRAFLKARESNPLRTGKLFVDDAREFEGNLIDYYFAQIQHLQVFDKDKGELINLEITEGELEKINKALDM